MDIKLVSIKNGLKGYNIKKDLKGHFLNVTIESTKKGAQNVVMISCNNCVLYYNVFNKFSDLLKWCKVNQINLI